MSKDDAPKARTAADFVREATITANRSNSADAVGGGHYDENGVFHIAPDKYAALMGALGEAIAYAAVGNTAMQQYQIWPPIQQPSPTLRLITKEAAAVLLYLHSQSPVLATLDEIEVGANLSRATANAACNELIGVGYASRPSGPRKGIAATETGVAVAHKLSTNSAQR